MVILYIRWYEMVLFDYKIPLHMHQTAVKMQMETKKPVQASCLY